MRLIMCIVPIVSVLINISLFVSLYSSCSSVSLRLFLCPLVHLFLPIFTFFHFFFFSFCLSTFSYCDLLLSLRPLPLFFAFPKLSFCCLNASSEISSWQTFFLDTCIMSQCFILATLYSYDYILGILK